MIVHAENEFVNIGGVMVRSEKVCPPVPHIPCVEHDCERCDQKIGWLEEYLGLMRPGSWVPPVLQICPDPRGTGKFLWEGGGILSDSSESD